MSERTPPGEAEPIYQLWSDAGFRALWDRVTWLIFCPGVPLTMLLLGAQPPRPGHRWSEGDAGIGWSIGGIGVLLLCIWFGTRWVLANTPTPLGDSMLLLSVSDTEVHVHVWGRGLDVPYRFVEGADYDVAGGKYGVPDAAFVIVRFTADADPALKPGAFGWNTVRTASLSRFEAQNLVD